MTIHKERQTMYKQLLKEAINDYKHTILLDPQASDEKVLGLMVAQNFDWSAISVLKTCFVATEEANCHSSAGKLCRDLKEMSNGLAMPTLNK